MQANANVLILTPVLTTSCDWLKKMLETEFVEPEKWPLNSPDLNPVEYSIWGALQQLFTVVVALKTLST